MVRGLAVVAHLVDARGTADLDSGCRSRPGDCIQSNSNALLVGISAALAPVAAASFAVEEVRRSWVEEKGMRVFQMISDLHPNT